ncbi:MAG: hypothetical protein N2260_09780 [Syntrophobacterales bacterium]|nr:hypothetical protein [Syntrophobacterales bacterium]
MRASIFSVLTGVLEDYHIRRFIMNPYFPLTFWVLNILELEGRGIFDHRSPLWIRGFLYHHLKVRLSCFAAIYRRLHPVLISSITKNFSINEIGNGYCDHCGQCCFFFGGLGEFPEPWPFPNRWKRFFTDGLGRHHLFCAFLWEWRHSGKSICSIYKWRPLVCDLFGEDECRYYLEAPHLPYVHLDRASRYVQKVLGIS